MAIQVHTYDTIIVGAGGAGMRAALEAGKSSRTAVLTKLYPTRSHTGAAQGGMCAALANVEEDNWEWHTFDTVKGGDYLVDQDAAEIMCKEAIDAVLDLENMGLPFNRTPEGKIDQRRFGGHTRDHGKAPVRRSCYAADRTGHMILQTLYQNCVKQRASSSSTSSTCWTCSTTDEDGDAAARPASSPTSWRPARCTCSAAKAVIFATGGFGKVFKTTSNAHTLTGDGMGIMWRRGLPLEDMEFYQFHPTGLAGLGILLTEGARGEGGILRNASGERFMERYAPTIKDLAPRDIVARSHGPGGRARAAAPARTRTTSTSTCTHLPAEQIEEKLPDITEFARTYLGVEPITEPVPVYPTAHYAMGGIPTNIQAEVLARQHHRRPGPVRGRRVRVRVGARLEPAGHQLAAGHQRVRPPRRAAPPREYVADRRAHAAAGGPGGRGASRWSRACAASTGTERVGADPHRAAGRRWTRTRGCTATTRRWPQAEEDVTELQARYTRRRRAGQGQAVQHRPAGGRRARLPARPGRGRWSSAARNRKESRGAHVARGLPDARRRELHEAHDGVPRDRRRRRRHDPSGLQAGRRHPLPADGA